MRPCSSLGTRSWMSSVLYTHTMELPQLRTTWARRPQHPAMSCNQRNHFEGFMSSEWRLHVVSEQQCQPMKDLIWSLLYVSM